MGNGRAHDGPMMGLWRIKPGIQDIISPNKVAELTSQTEYFQFLEECAEIDALACVKFHAEWCKSCQAFGVKFSRLSTRSPSSVRYASLEFGSNPNLCRSLGVTHLPSVQFYDGGRGKLESFSCSPKNFAKVKDAVERLVDEKEKDALGE
ncbi:hypothetical protein TrRE_jg2525 [Triparma retinervis]|uniref:Thioredoxin domain-containing protein n=1 Tax=Triparma retinervis TaxID=2557542 RepID=A0A9W7DNA3_9STRA|nr:hypothetical protein TrRE_jg2525 [Triparma retinervis]